jgi:hypothetical protein
MTSETDIANLALDACSNRNVIGDLTEDSVEAQAARRNFGPTRDQILRAARWGFANKIDLLTLLKAAPGTPEGPTTTTSTWTSAAPMPPWLYSYAYPSDALAVWRILPQLGNAPQGIPIFPYANYGMMPGSLQLETSTRFNVGSDKDGGGNQIKIVLTNTTQAMAIYCVSVSDPNLWDALFAEAMVKALASKLALSLSGDKGMHKINAQAANDAIIMARVANANEEVVTTDRDADWINARVNRSYAWQLGYIVGPYGPLFPVF